MPATVAEGDEDGIELDASIDSDASTDDEVTEDPAGDENAAELDWATTETEIETEELNALADDTKSEEEAALADDEIIEDETSPEALNCEDDGSADDGNTDEEASVDGLDNTTEESDEDAMKEREDETSPEALGKAIIELGESEEEIWRLFEGAIDESNDELSPKELDDTTTEIEDEAKSEEAINDCDAESDDVTEETATEMSELELAYEMLGEAEEGEEMQEGIETPVASPTKKARCVPAGGEVSEQEKKLCEQEFVDVV
jgi:hypothetical protein